MRGNFKSPKSSKTLASRQSPDGTGSSKSNHWSAKAREDIYSRRQNGEEWETICKDYPSRTRHAMQQQYSVMRKQNATDNPGNTPTRRGGRRRRGVSRGTKWAAVNQRLDSSEDGADSDVQPDLELDDDDDDDDDDDEYDGMEVAEEEPMVEEEAPSPRASSPARIDKSPGPSRRQSTSKETLKRRYSSKESKRSSISKKALFPNLTSRPVDLVDLSPMDSEPKPAQPDPKPAKRRASKRQIDADIDGSDSESRSSSRLSKRRKYSTEPSEPLTILPADSAASVRLLEGFKLPGLFLHPDAITKAREDWRNMATAYESEKASRKETFEAALKRATRRANEAEHKLQDASQEYADKLKLEKEVQGKALEATQTELQAEKDKNKDSANLDDMVAQLSAKEEQLKLYDALRAQINTQVEQLKALHVTAFENSESVENQQSDLAECIEKFADENWAEMGVGRLIGTVKRFGKEVRDSNLTLKEKLEEARGTWRKTSEAVSAFHAQFGADTLRSMDTSD